MASSEEITVSSKVSGYVHGETVTVYKSKFFKAAFYGEFKEASEGTLDLPEEEVNTFRAFVHLLYTNEARAGPNCSKVSEVLLKDFVLLWMMTDILEAQELQNIVATALVDAWNMQVIRFSDTSIDEFLEVISVAYQHEQDTGVSTIRLLRRLLGEMYIDTYDELCVEPSLMPQSFAIDVIVILREKLLREKLLGTQTHRTPLSLCELYHTHDKGHEPCDWNVWAPPPPQILAKRKR
ncbi:MAG: hypothetical protein M1829_002482 [Trizodia sp. TS-e1964]|nr:MAG: hypothetical protein M1829_002482 [Trizodia sp. TS-e1964]